MTGRYARNSDRIHKALKSVRAAQDQRPQPGPMKDGVFGEWVVVNSSRDREEIWKKITLLKLKGIEARRVRRGVTTVIEVQAFDFELAVSYIEQYQELLSQRFVRTPVGLQTVLSGMTLGCASLGSTHLVFLLVAVLMYGVLFHPHSPVLLIAALTISSTIIAAVEGIAKSHVVASRLGEQRREWIRAVEQLNCRRVRWLLRGYS